MGAATGLVDGRGTGVEAPVARPTVARPSSESRNDVSTTATLPGAHPEAPQQQYGHDPVVRRLLWEIRCLQVVIMRARQLEQSMERGDGTTDTGIIVGALRRELAAETWLLEWEMELATCGKMPP